MKLRRFDAYTDFGIGKGALGCYADFLPIIILLAIRPLCVVQCYSRIRHAKHCGCDFE
jgi:hypothetical protein